MLVKVFVCLVAALSAACAYGSGSYDNKWMPSSDGGNAHFDAAHDTGAADVAVDQGSLGPPDVLQPQMCTLSLPTGDPTCDGCLQTSCCAEDNGCGTDSSCLSLISCMDACVPTDGGPPDTTCMSTCQAENPTGANELSVLDSCMSAQCRSECGGP